MNLKNKIQELCCNNTVFILFLNSVFVLALIDQIQSHWRLTLFFQVIIISYLLLTDIINHRVFQLFNKFSNLLCFFSTSMILLHCYSSVDLFFYISVVSIMFAAILYVAILAHFYFDLNVYDEMTEEFNNGTFLSFVDEQALKIKIFKIETLKTPMTVYFYLPSLNLWFDDYTLKIGSNGDKITYNSYLNFVDDSSINKQLNLYNNDELQLLEAYCI